MRVVDILKRTQENREMPRDACEGDLSQIGASITERVRYTIHGRGPCRISRAVPHRISALPPGHVKGFSPGSAGTVSGGQSWATQVFLAEGAIGRKPDSKTRRLPDLQFFLL